MDVDVDVVESYLLDLRRRGLSEGTIYRRRGCIELLAREHDLATVSSEAIQQFLDTRELSARTRYSWLSHLSVFFAWAVAHEYFAANPVAKLQRPKMRRLVPKPTPEREVQRAVCAATTPLLRQWVVLMAYAGLRCAEVAGLQGEDVDIDERVMRVFGKGSKWRSIPLHPLVVEQLAGVSPDAGPVFIDPATGAPYTPAQVSRLVGRYLRSLGCTHNRAHLLRHRFASHLLEEGADIADVAALLGHESLNTTTIYAAASMRRMRRALRLIS